MTTEQLAVPGATLHVETAGEGPPLLLVVGGNGDCAVYGGLAAALPGRTTVTWDRRGFTRSPLDGPVPADRLAADVADAVLLIDRLGGRADVFGSSSGAIVALALAVAHPERVATVVAHEPPLLRLLPDGAAWEARHEVLHQRFLDDGLGPAMAEFSAAIGMPRGPEMPSAAALPPAVAAIMQRAPANMAFWFEHELRQYPVWEPDLDALRRVRLVLAGGRESRGHMPYRPNLTLAKELGTEIVDFPGGHAGYGQYPVEAAEILDRILTRGR